MQVSSSSTQGRSLHGATLDPKRLLSVMGAFATGVAVIATEWSGELFGATVNSLTSLQPCMLLFCTSEGSATGAAIRRRRLFSVNIARRQMQHLALGNNTPIDQMQLAVPIVGPTGAATVDDVAQLPSRSFQDTHCKFLSHGR
jgi:hypothetical protein